LASSLDTRGAYRQDARTHPVLPDEQRSQGNVARTHQVGMESILATLTHKSESLVGTVRLAGVSAPWASEATVVGIHLHRHAPHKRGFVGHDTKPVLQQNTQASGAQQGQTTKLSLHVTIQQRITIFACFALMFLLSGFDLMGSSSSTCIR